MPGVATHAIRAGAWLHLGLFAAALLLWVGVVATSWLLVWLAFGTPAITAHAWDLRENYTWMVLLGMMGLAAMLTAGAARGKQRISPVLAAAVVGMGHLLLILFCQRLSIEPRVTLLPDSQTDLPGRLAFISELVALFVVSAVVGRLPQPRQAADENR